MQTQISLNTLRLDHERFDRLVNKLEERFAWQPVHPKEDLSSIMYRAGQQSVVQYVKQQLEDE